MILRNLFVTFLAFVAWGIQTNAGEIPRKEYPRPQFERKTWLNLNGEWDYAFDFTNIGMEKEFHKATTFSGKITVPFPPESKLSGVEHKDFINHIWYHRIIRRPEEWAGKNVILNFGAVYFNSEIYIDGKLVGRHFGGSSSFGFDITGYVEDGLEHHLVVRASSDLRSMMQSAGKQSLLLNSHGCQYTRTTGIWQTVWLEAVASAGLQSVHALTDIDQKQLVIHPRFYRDSYKNTLRIVLQENNKKIGTVCVKAANSSVAVFSLKNVRLWSPESPFLYDVLYQVLDENGKVIDEVTSYVGMRKVHIEGNKIYLNNKPYYQRLVLDQGEAPSWGMDANSIEVARNFLQEWSELVLRDRNHPSLLIWTPMNEEWWPDHIQYPRFTADLYDLTKSLDPTRPVNDASGGCHIKTDIWTVHSYEQDPAALKDALYKDGVFFQTPNNPQGVPSANVGFNGLGVDSPYPFPKYEGDMPYLIDEVGGIKWVETKDKSNTDSSWGYSTPPATQEEFLQRLESQIDAILSLKEYVWGYCYTQLTDVEQEQNGIFFYDRRSKFDLKLISRIFSKTPRE